jgi:hypothetical protein
MNDRIVKKYFNIENLRLAWERMIRSNGRDSKDIFGIEIFSVNLEKNLSSLNAAFKNKQYKPSRPFKYYEPKASKTHRTKSVFCIEDAIIYQAIVNIIATTNYKKLSDNNQFVFGSVLHSEVQKGTDILKNEDAEFYFFEYYIPLYNRFVNSINEEIENTNIKFKLETDITGFFDSIPHSKLLLTLHNFGVEPEILDLLSNCLNIWSGTRDSVTIGVGIPQGAAPSFFLANVFLNELDYKISQEGYTYYRYMDDIRIYEETEEKLSEALVLIDNYLKGNALSLNTKKTSIEEVLPNRETEKLMTLTGYGTTDIEYYNEKSKSKSSKDIYITEQNPDNNQSGKYIIKTIKGQELITFCLNEIKEVESSLLKTFSSLKSKNFSPRDILSSDSFTKKIVHQAYRWRSANGILKQEKKQLLNKEMIDIWLFCVQYVFWKANHFCWNLNQYGKNDYIKEELNDIFNNLKYYEWARYQILSNMAFVQDFNQTELKDLFRVAKRESSPLVRLGYFKILLSQLRPSQQLFTALNLAIQNEVEPYIKKSLLPVLKKSKVKNHIDNINFWFGL